MRDDVLGKHVIAVASALFAYYTVWVLVVPWVDHGHAFRSYFPHRWWALVIPTLSVVAPICIVLTFLGSLFVLSGYKLIRRERNALRRSNALP